MIVGIDFVISYFVFIFMVWPAMLGAAILFFKVDFDTMTLWWMAGAAFPVTILCGVFIGILWVGKRAWISRKSLIVAIINWLTPKAGK